MIQKLLAILGRRSMPLLVCGIVVGLAAPPLAAALRPFAAPLVFLLTAATLLTIEPRTVVAEIRKPGRLALVLAWAMVLEPLLMALALLALDIPRGLVEALVLWAAAAPLISSPALAFLLGLEVPLALVGMMFGQLAMPATLPPLALALLGLELQIGVGELMLRLALFVGGALVLAVVIRRLIGAARIDRARMEISGLAVLFLVLFGIGIMDGVQATFVREPVRVALFAAAGFAATTLSFACGAVVFAWAGMRTALTIGLLAGYRNMAIVWASLGAAASPDVTLFFVMIQLPIYLLPPLLRPLVRALTVTETKR